MAAKLLAIHPRPVSAGRRSPDVDEFRFSTDVDAPAAVLQTPTEIDLFVEHEEARIESADLLDRLAAKQEHRADEEPPPGTHPQARTKESARRRRDGGSTGPPPRGQPHERLLLPTIRGMKLWRDCPEPRLLHRAGSQALDPVTHRPSIRVEQQDEWRACFSQPFVARRAVADILVQLDQPYAGKAIANEPTALIGGRVVDHDHLSFGAGDRGKGPLEVDARVVGDDDDGDRAHSGRSTDPRELDTQIGRSAGAGPKRILVVLPYSPRLDARHGGKAVAQLLMRLSDRHRLALVHLRRPHEDPADDWLRERCDLVEAITVGDPADSRRWRRGAKVVRGLIKGKPIQVVDFSSGEYAARLREVALRWKPQVIHVELEAMGQYLPLFDEFPGRRVLVLVEPAARTAEEIWQTSTGLNRIVRFLDRRAWRMFERTIAGEAHAVVVLTEGDREAALVVAGGAQVHTIPLGTELPPQPLDPLGTPPPTVLFVGGFGHPPNVEAALTLAKRIFPDVVAQRPESRLYLVGDKPPAEIQALADDCVIVTGAVPDVLPYLEQAAVVVAPVAVGGGMRLKVLEALAAGKALVATPLAVEGLAIRDGEHALVVDSDEAFAEALLRLLDDPGERRRLGAGARKWAEQHLDLALSAAAYERLYDELLSTSPP
jgi:glycosyltransferase involved in cell wall biosynthesis